MGPLPADAFFRAASVPKKGLWSAPLLGARLATHLLFFGDKNKFPEVWGRPETFSAGRQDRWKKRRRKGAPHRDVRYAMAAPGFCGGTGCRNRWGCGCLVRGLCSFTRRLIRRSRVTAIASGFRRARCFRLDRTAFLATTTALAVFEAATDRGLRFQLGFGAQTEGYRASGLALAQFSYSWGLRYRTGDGRAGIGGMPDWYLDYFGGRSHPRSRRLHLYRPEQHRTAEDHLHRRARSHRRESTIIHRDGRRFPVGLHVDRQDRRDADDGGSGNPCAADERRPSWRLSSSSSSRRCSGANKKSGKPCFLRGGILHAVSDASLASMVAFDDHGSGASLLGCELARMIFCDSEPLASGAVAAVAPRQRAWADRSIAGGKVRDIIEHEKPVVPTKPSPDAKPAPPPAVPQTLLFRTLLRRLRRRRRKRRTF